MKCDVSFSQSSVSTIFRWGGHFSYLCKMSSCLQQCKHCKNRSIFSKVMITHVLPPFYGSQCRSEHYKTSKHHHAIDYAIYCQFCRLHIESYDILTEIDWLVCSKASRAMYIYTELIIHQYTNTHAGHL